MLLWEISSEQPPFANYNDDYRHAMDIVSGMRPKIISGTPSKYKELMEQCWDADKKSDLEILSCYYASSRLSTSKVYKFDNLLEPRNATESYHSKLYNFNIPEDIDDLNLNNDSASKTTSDFKGNSKALSKVFQKLRLGSGDNNQDNYGKEIVKQQIKETRYNEEDIFNNPNIDSKDQEIPDGNLI
uniref:Serine-threonine/tyrosine-protein kinase catalytic domain-containing protein n=1 Tax=Rhizophagus irregularis (strain DAOM 181602 / DAOM 197198 / MUCL 43194) TaxID=747089 RepID=U9UE70_RHIID